jgi:hypothetical protein
MKALSLLLAIAALLLSVTCCNASLLGDLMVRLGIRPAPPPAAVCAPPQAQQTTQQAVSRDALIERVRATNRRVRALDADLKAQGAK